MPDKTDLKEKLETYLKNSKKFNIFKVLKLEDMEIRHSNFLAWLLNPNENHNIERLFFNKFCEKSGIDNEKFKNIKIAREEAHIDILIKDNINKQYIIIENKYGIKEHGNQLNRYYDYVKDKYKVDEDNIYKIYLDIDKEDYIEKDFGYKTLTYKEDILPILEEIILKMEKDSPEKHAVCQYIAILNEKYEKKYDLKNICLNLHKSNPNDDEYKVIIDEMINHRRFEIMDVIKTILLSKNYYVPTDKKIVYRVIFSKNEDEYKNGNYYEFDNPTNKDYSSTIILKDKNNKELHKIDVTEYNEIFYLNYDEMKRSLKNKIEKILEDNKDNM